MAKIEKIGNIQIVDNKEDKSFYFPMISMVCTGVCIATGSFGLPDLHHKHAPSDHSEYLSITTIRPLMGADGFLIIAEQIST